MSREADEASLFRLGGFALFSLQKAYKCHSESVTQHKVLQSLKLPSEEKIDLPPNIAHLDTGNTVTFMKKELLGYLAEVCDSFRVVSYRVW